MSPQSVFTEPTGLANEFLETWRFGVTIWFEHFQEPIFTSLFAFETGLEEYKMAQSTTTAPFTFQAPNSTMGGNTESSLNPVIAPT